ncbi:type I-E CRISPR-associated protein Cse1/CasA [Xylanimonas allomyrinae]|uniref:Type I-E CRISPR-associated protein Cse1/CasA n=1 Tax=Xylanimonas allomyrinae TaxID=2509459 RepID=A0A4P6ENU0_9MICO|nr:type I-E CRISPR-associated protein Cse1/CasA [Xylanimonas allomyrinae]QAY64106.1 type I-E CRISPR-associated protein Cse1/CasA [Xylanimonas allomyrinae]
MSDLHFNLVDEPWIPVLSTQGRASEVSLREVFHRARDVVTLTGELPTQSVALLRLLLAVLHRAVEGPVRLEDWAEVRDRWDETVEDVDSYLDDWHDRFWMQHPAQPFMQVPDLRTAKDEVFGLERIVCDGPGTSTFLTTRVGAALQTASWPEAARWLVHVHAYDVSGIHSGAVGDPRVKGGKGYGIGTGWAGQIGALHLVGDDLRETLLLNLLVPGAAGMEVDAGADLPVWERPPLGVLPEGWHPDDGADQAYRRPRGPVDLYTWPTRRIRLEGTPERATGVVNAQGDRATPHNRFTVEPMTAWRHSDPQTKKFGHDTYMPLKHERSRAAWRGLEALLPRTSHPAKDGGPVRRRPPALAEWAAQLGTAELVGPGLLRWRAVGIEYGSNESVYDEIVADELALPAALFTDHELAQLAVDAVDAAEKAVFALGSLAQNVALAAGGSTESDAPRTRVATRAYAELDPEFRTWLRTLTAGADPLERRAAWHRSVLWLVNDLADEEVDDAGPAALVGRTAGGQFRDAGLALHWFRKKVRDVLPHAFAPHPPTAPSNPEETP